MADRRTYTAECIQRVQEYRQRNVHIRSLISKQPQYAFVGDVDIVRPSFMNNLLYQQRRSVRDSSNRRWMRCESCGKIGTSDKFWTYGGKDHVNLGECYDCRDLNNSDK